MLKPIENNTVINGLYAITHHEHLSQAKMLSDLEAVIRGGANIVQYRDKLSKPQERKQRSLALQKLCRRLNVLFLINDDIELCASIHADGVHLGTKDSSITCARSQLGGKAIIGATCHDSLELALAAKKQGANYIALGRFFPSQSKPNAKAANISCINSIKHQVKLPIVAIGGITLDNAAKLIEQGANSIAMINDLYNHENTEEHAQELCQLFN